MKKRRPDYYQAHWYRCLLRFRQSKGIFDKPHADIEWEDLIKSEFSVISDSDIQWLAEALADEDCKWLVAHVCRFNQPMPEALLEPIIRAAVHELNPSSDRQFVEPAIKTFGHQKVTELLHHYVRNGTNREKAGAVRALYWTSVSAPAPQYQTPEQTALIESLQPLWQVEQEMLLQEFVQNSDLLVRRSIIPQLDLDKSRYPDELMLFVDQAIEIARSHPDEYIRHRVEVQLGSGGALKPLPPPPKE